MSDIEVELPKEDFTEVVNDAVLEVEVGKEKKPKKAQVDVDQALSELKDRLENVERARQDAEKRARDAETIAMSAKNEVTDTNMHLLNNAIDTVKRDVSILKANYRHALASGDYGEAAEIQEQMSQNTSKLLRLEEGKSEMEKMPRQEVPSYHSGDPVEAFASRLSYESAKWIRAHPEYVTNPNMNQMMIGAHTLAKGRGIVEDTPEYFNFIENTLGIEGNDSYVPRGRSEDTQAASGGRQAAPMAAPVSRSASTTGSSRPNVVRLSEAERETAEALGMTYQEYAKNKLDLQRAGKLN
jgi:hypothetical protein